MATSGSFSTASWTSDQSTQSHFEFQWQRVSKNDDNLTSYIYCKVILTGTYNGNVKADWTVKINGSIVHQYNEASTWVSRSQNAVIYEGYFTVYHDSSGNGSFNASIEDAYIYVRRSASGTNYAASLSVKTFYPDTIDAYGWVNIPSSLSISDTVWNLTIKNNSNYNYIVEVFGKGSGITDDEESIIWQGVSAPNATITVTDDCRKSLLSSYPTSSSCVCTFRLHIYRNTDWITSKDKTATVYFNGAKMGSPSIDGVDDPLESSSFVLGKGITDFVQGYSIPKFGLSVYTYDYSALSKVEVSFNGVTKEFTNISDTYINEQGESSSYVYFKQYSINDLVGNIAMTGMSTNSCVFSVKTTDSRGYTDVFVWDAESLGDIVIKPYSTPSLTIGSAYRYSSIGSGSVPQIDEDGENIYCKLKPSYSQYNVSSTNANTGCKIKYTIDNKTCTKTVTDGGANDVNFYSSSDFTAAVFSTDQYYKLKIQAEDQLGNKSVVYEVNIPSKFYLMDWHKSGKSIGFGIAAEAPGTDHTNGLITSRMDMKIYGDVSIQQEEGSTEVPGLNVAGDALFNSGAHIRKNDVEITGGDGRYASGYVNYDGVVPFVKTANNDVFNNDSEKGGLYRAYKLKDCYRYMIICGHPYTTNAHRVSIYDAYLDGRIPAAGSGHDWLSNGENIIDIVNTSSSSGASIYFQVERVAGEEDTILLKVCARTVNPETSEGGYSATDIKTSIMCLGRWNIDDNTWPSRSN